MKNSKLITIGIVALIIGGAAGFFGGMYYQKSQVSQRANFQFGQNRQGVGGFRMGMMGGQNGTRPIAGEILSTDQGSITVKLPDGQSKIVILTDKTLINKAATGSAEDLKAGVTVAVFGPANSDGSTTAQNIQIRPSRVN